MCRRDSVDVAHVVDGALKTVDVRVGGVVLFC